MPAKICKPKPALVTCASCRHFRRDTTGPSYNAYTHVYFMGVCTLGLDPDRTFNERTGKAEIFADHNRECTKHLTK